MNDFEIETWDKSLITEDNYSYEKSMFGRNISSGYFMPPHRKWNFHISVIMCGVLPSPVDILCIGVNDHAYGYLRHMNYEHNHLTTCLDVVDLIGQMQEQDKIYERPIPHTRNLTKDFRHPDNLCTEWHVMEEEHIVGLNTDMSYVLFKPHNPSKGHHPAVWIDDTHFRSYVASKVYGVDMYLQEGLINILTKREEKLKEQKKEELKEQKFVDWKNDASIIL